MEEFRSFAENLNEPFRTIALLCVCLGLRISECLALKWSDVDWLNSKLQVERGIVCQQVDDVKSEESRKQLTIDRELLTALQTWKREAQFSDSDDCSWLDPVGVQQRLMRHTDVRTTMRCGDAFTSDMAEAHGKVVSLALNGAQTERKPS